LIRGRKPSGRKPGLASDRAGTMALEFALIAPVMATLLCATIELGNAFRVQAKVNTAAGQLAELVAGQQAVTASNGNLADMCAGAAMNLLPYASRNFAADIVSGTDDHPSNRMAGSTDSTSVGPYLDWENISSCPTASPTTLGASGAYALASSPASMLTKSGAAYSSDYVQGYSVIVVRASFTYQNVLPLFLGSSITFTAVAVHRPRQNSEIRCTNPASSPPGAACPSLQ